MRSSRFASKARFTLRRRACSRRCSSSASRASARRSRSSSAASAADLAGAQQARARNGGAMLPLSLPHDSNPLLNWRATRLKVLMARASLSGCPPATVGTAYRNLLPPSGIFRERRLRRAAARELQMVRASRSDWPRAVLTSYLAGIAQIRQTTSLYGMSTAPVTNWTAPAGGSCGHEFEQAETMPWGLVEWMFAELRIGGGPNCAVDHLSKCTRTKNGYLVGFELLYLTQRNVLDSARGARRAAPPR